MRKVCRLAREVLDIAAREAKPGVTTDHIDKVVHDACMERNVRCETEHERRNAPLTLFAVIPIPAELLPLPQVRMHVTQRGHLPRYPRSAPAEGRRHS